MHLSLGKPDPLGASITSKGVNFAVFSANAEAIDIFLYDENENEIGCFSLSNKFGNIFYAHINDAKEGMLYGLRVYGENNPKNGNKFNPNKLLLDPYALEINRPFKLCEEILNPDINSAQYVPKARIIRPIITEATASKIIPEETIIYEMHVAGFTKNLGSIPKEIRGTFKALASQDSINYFKNLGVNTIELLPTNAWIEENHLRKLGLTNYWGYNSIGFMCPDPKLAPNGWKEIRESVKTLEANGIETILDVVFNHTGEGDKYGPTLSFRGIDNKTYYRLPDGDLSDYINDSGTGNILDCDEPIVIRLILDSLRTWHRLGGIHGFRFDLASVLGRSKYGYDKNSPLLNAIINAPDLSKLKLIAEPWDCGPGGYQVGNFPDEYIEWNDKYRDDMRKFWLGENSLSNFATRFCGSQDIYKSRLPLKSVNFICAHDGFSLQDLVSYNQKHNEANGENNRDGTNDNYSNNHGFEGETSDENISAERLKSQKALIATLLLSRGTPMLSMGMENGKTQFGNNNAYAQDNEITYIDWENINTELLDFTKKLIEIRKSHPALNANEFLTGTVQRDSLYKDIEWRNHNGDFPSDFEWNSSQNKQIGICLCKNSDRVFIIINANQQEQEFILPIPNDGYEWEILAANTNTLDINDLKFIAPSRSIIIFGEKISKTAQYLPTSETLNKLITVLGIEKEWWDITGKNTQVSFEAIKQIVKSMGYDCETETKCLKSLKEYSEKFERRLLPFYLCFDETEQVSIDILQNKLSSNYLYIKGENFNLKIKISKENIIEIINKDGVKSLYLRQEIKGLKIGRYEIWCEHQPEIMTKLTIAPKNAYLPEALEIKKISGLSTQIYATKRDGDQGIGDFTNLKHALKETEKAGLAILAINPLHALFPFNRDRASPYYPSDRRFLEPHYINCDIFEDYKAYKTNSVIDYADVWNFKNKILQKEYLKLENIETDTDTSIIDFATFQALSEKFNGLNWHEWPEKYRLKDSKTIEEFKAKNQKRINYHIYLQSLCNLQFNEAKNNNLEIGLCRDLAIGSAPDGAEAWCNQTNIICNISIGAPPDPMGPKGQVWGLPPYNPLKLIETACENYIELFKTNMKYAGALRIDHAMGLMRQFWVPNGMDGADGTYVNFPFKHLLSELKLESHLSKCLIIGEDLGTVPHGFSEMMQSQNIYSYKVLQFELNDSFRPSEHYPSNSFTCAATHDLPPLIGWWENIDILERKAIGYYTQEETNDAIKQRDKEKQQLIYALKCHDLLYNDEIPQNMDMDLISKIHAFIASSSSKIIISQFEDLCADKIPINLPGTNMERPNWRNRQSKTIHEIFAIDNYWSKEILNRIKNRNQ